MAGALRRVWHGTFSEKEGGGEPINPYDSEHWAEKLDIASQSLLGCVRLCRPIRSFLIFMLVSIISVQRIVYSLCHEKLRDTLEAESAEIVMLLKSYSSSGRYVWSYSDIISKVVSGQPVMVISLGWASR